MNPFSKLATRSKASGRSLRPALILNAIFSSLSGVFLVLAGEFVASSLGSESVWVYTMLGFGLVFFALILVVAAVRPTPIAVLAITAADIGWIVFSTAAAVVLASAITPLGWGLVLGTNVVVSILAWLQLRSIRRFFRAAEGSPDEYEVCITAEANVSADAFWEVLADLGAIQRYMPSLKSSALTVGERPGVGCVRTCENVKGQVWSEKCEAWDEGRSFEVTFLADEPDFPFPFSRMRGGWRVSPSAAGCQVQVWWRVIPRRRWTAAILLPLMAANAQRSFGGVIARMANQAVSETANSGAPTAFPRLSLELC